VADAQICVTIFSIITLEFTDNTEVYVGYIMMALSFGMMMGPVISSVVYPHLGYSGTFYFFAGFILVFGLLPLFFVPARLNKKSEKNEGDLKVTFGIFVKNRFVVTMIVILIGSMVCMQWTIPTLSNELVDYHSISEANAGLFFALMACTAGVGSPILGKLCKYVHRKWICLFGLLV